MNHAASKRPLTSVPHMARVRWSPEGVRVGQHRWQGDAVQAVYTLRDANYR